jgi:hypothetical protein
MLAIVSHARAMQLVHRPEKAEVDYQNNMQEYSPQAVIVSKSKRLHSSTKLTHIQ